MKLFTAFFLFATLLFASEAAAQLTTTTDSLPPKGGEYKSASTDTARYPQIGFKLSSIDMKNFSPPSAPPPPLGNGRTYTFVCQMDFDLAPGGHQTHAANGFMSAQHTRDSASTRFFDTEMLALSLTGTGYMIRESPTKASTGKTTIQDLGGGQFQINSFFDVFTEISLDGGATWDTAQTSTRVSIPIVTTPIGGTKFEDINGNGIQDFGEPGLSGWQVQLCDTLGNVLGTANTGVNGNYSFPNVAAGKYLVKEVPQAGWMQTGGQPVYTLIVIQGQPQNGINFGNVHTPTLYGHKFLDVNHDGIHQPNEPYLPDWGICLYPKNTSNPSIDVATTTSSYRLNGLPPSEPVIGTMRGYMGDHRGQYETQSQTIPIELIALSLQSSEPIKVGDSFFDVFTELSVSGGGTVHRSLGAVNGNGGGPASSFFDIFVEVDIVNRSGGPGGMQLISHNPVRLTGTAPSVPFPVGTTWDGGNIPLFDKGTDVPVCMLEDLTLTTGAPATQQNPICLKTDSSGQYCFMSVPPGTYNIVEVPESGWTQTTPDPGPIVISSGTADTINIGNRDTIPPVITTTTTWTDKLCEDNKGPFPLMVNVLDNSFRQPGGGPGGGRISSFFDVFTEISINGGAYSHTPMNLNSFFDVFTEIGGGGEYWDYAPSPQEGYPAGTDIQARIRAVDLSGNVSIFQYGNITIVPRRPILKPFFPAPFKKQSTFENNWYGKGSNSWCGPTAASSCLQRLGVPGLPNDKNALVSALAQQMNTDNIAKNGAVGTGSPGAGTVFWQTAADNGFVWGLNKYLTLLGQRLNYTIKIYNPNSDPINGHDILYSRYPTYSDYENELHNGEDVMIRIRYGPTDKTLQNGGHWLVGIGQIDAQGTNPNTIMVMDPATGDTASIRWTGINTGTYAGTTVTIKSLVVVSPKGNRAISLVTTPTFRAALGIAYTPQANVQNTHTFEHIKNLHVTCTIPSFGYADTQLVPLILPGVTQNVQFAPTTPQSIGFFDIFYKVEPGDTDPSDDSVHAVMVVEDSTKFRTASMLDWAAQLKPIKCKPTRTKFKFNLGIPRDTLANAPQTLLLKFNMPIETLLVSRDKIKGDTVPCIKSITIDTKRQVWIYDFNGCPPQPILFSYQLLQFDGIGSKAKQLSVNYAWFKAGQTRTTLKGSLPRGPRLLPQDTIKQNTLLLPMPNLANVLQELYLQQAIFTVGIDTHQVVFDGYKDILKTLNSRGLTQDGAARCLDSIKGRPVKKPIHHGLPPTTASNRLVGEDLTLWLNIGSSVLLKFPDGFYDLVYDNSADTATVFDGMSITQIATYADSILGCVATVPSSPNYVATVLHNINAAFVGPLDTISWNCSKLFLTGVSSVVSSNFLHTGPHAAPRAGFMKGITANPYVAQRFHMDQNYPNPFNPTTTIKFVLPEDAVVTLTIYNLLGQEVATVLNHEQMDQGPDDVTFDASNLPSGVYFYRIVAQVAGDPDAGVQAKTFTEVKKMMLIK